MSGPDDKGEAPEAPRAELTVAARMGKLQGAYRGTAAVNDRLAFASEHCHLVSPFPAVGRLPEGFGVQIALVRVVPGMDTYPVKGDKPLALGKPALDRIGHALGLTWDVHESRRLDDGSNPHYCHYRAVGSYRASDGQQIAIKGEKEADYREGSAQLSGKSAGQINGMREHILSRAETMSRLRAIRSMGIATSYTKHDLELPFACVRLVFTGESDDPALRAQFAAMTAASVLGAEAALYPQAARYAGGPALPAPREQLTHPPPPVGAPAIVDADAFPGDDE